MTIKNHISIKKTRQSYNVVKSTNLSSCISAYETHDNLQTTSLKLVKYKKAQLLQRPHDILCYVGRPQLWCIITKLAQYGD